jgi:hypothetical protein
VLDGNPEPDLVHATGCKQPTLRSCRSISLLPIVPKVFEKLLLKRPLQMFEYIRLILDHLFGCRQRNSTIELIHLIVRRINDALENKQYCSAARLDITQAFDKAWDTTSVQTKTVAYS